MHTHLILVCLLVAFFSGSPSFGGEHEDHEHDEHKQHDHENDRPQKDAHDEGEEKHGETPHAEEHADHAEDHDEHEQDDDGHQHQKKDAHDKDEERSGKKQHVEKRADHGAEHADHGDEHGEHEGEKVVRRTPEELARFGVTLQVAGPGRIDRGIELLGEIRPNGDTLAHIVPRFAGVALAVNKAVGDHVTNKDVLATIQSNESLSPYELRSLTEGTIIEKHITRGEAVDRDTPSFVIADLSTVWIDLSVYQKDIHEVSVGQAVRVFCHGMPDAEGTISYLAPVVDEPTRTAVARVVLPNPDRLWRPGLFVTGRILDPIESPIAVPRSAVQTIEAAPSVFIKTDKGFEPRPIVLGRGGETMVEVVSGLAAGEAYAATNSFLLKAELGKGEAEHAH